MMVDTYYCLTCNYYDFENDSCKLQSREWKFLSKIEIFLLIVLCLSVKIGRVFYNFLINLNYADK